MTDSKVTVFNSVSDVYDDSAVALVQAHRWDHLASEFQKRFGRAPTHICRAPGRVNLIGEHIDYALFGVFPAAIDRDILIACAPRSDSSEIHAQNLDGDKYTAQTFSATRVGDTAGAVKGDAWTLDIDKKKLRWESYVKAGYFVSDIRDEWKGLAVDAHYCYSGLVGVKGVLNRFFAGSDAEPTGVDLLFTGAVPAGSGLSSSAAMVVASTLAFLTMNNKLDSMTKGDLVDMTVENEKRVGVNSGGMDQSASILSLPQHALYISFFPSLSPTQIPLPTTNPPTSLVIANSLVVSDKVVSAKVQYNLRVVETLVGARVLARGLGLEVGPKEKITLREVLSKWTGHHKAGTKWEEDVDALHDALERIGPEVERILGAGNGKKGLDYNEMVEASGLGKDEFHEVYFSWVDVEATHFQLYQRARHVFEEALRVLQFRKIALSSSGSEDTHLQLGALLDASHASCRDQFDCSCKELDELTSIAKKAGAWGSRLTGAGWGGCTVSLVSEADVPKFIETVSKEYGPYKGLDKAALEQVIFATKPGSGAGVYVVS